MNKSKNLIIGCIYRHPHSTNLDEFIVYMKACLDKLQKENKEVYITGDFNIDLLKYEKNPKYQEFYNLMTSSGFLPYIILPTRITDTTMTIIDNIYSNNIIIPLSDPIYVLVRQEFLRFHDHNIYKEYSC